MTGYQDMSPAPPTEAPVTYGQWLLVKKLFAPLEPLQQQEEAS